MNKIIFILGGARSGKSTYALRLAKKIKKVAFIATCEALDTEMTQRISLHKASRPAHWKTIEEPREIAPVIKRLGEVDCVIIDCLTLLVSNLLLTKLTQEAIIEKIDKLLSQIQKFKGTVILVSNEVGLGIVPDNRLARHFRDVAGFVNQRVAQKANEVFFMVSGIPAKIKGSK